MASLNWIGKEAVVDYHRRVPLRLLVCDKDLSAGDPEAGNLLVQGDNLEALKALLPRYKGQVKCIYIDPPYNTGKESWIYNDNVNDPRIKKWLGQVVGKEAEDLCRHDKWLCMMYPRLMLLKEFLANDGVLFVSIDDNELHNCRTLLDEMFRPQNLLACFVWQTDGNMDNQAKVKIAHEYVLAYTPNIRAFAAPSVIDPSISKTSKLFRPEIRNTVTKNGPGNPVSEFKLPVGFPADFKEGIIAARTDKWPQYDTDVIVRDFKVAESVVARSGWSSKRIMTNFVNAGYQPVRDTKKQLSRFVLTETGAVEAVKERSQAQSHVISVIREVGNVQTAGAALEKMGISFPYPKPMGLLQYLLSMTAGGETEPVLILDSFAGSGTTGHTVLEMKKPGEKRTFILIEMDEKIAVNVAALRLKKAILGYDVDGQRIAPLGGGFRFCRLSNTLFDEHGEINQDVPFADLARYVYLIETGVPVPTRPRKDQPLLGVHEGRAVYLLYNGVLGDKKPAGGNVLTHGVLDALGAHPLGEGHPRVIYGEACRLGDATLQRYNVTFRQTPYALREG